MLYGGSILYPVSIYDSHSEQFCTVQSYQLFMGLGRMFSIFNTIFIICICKYFSGQRHISVQSCFEDQEEEKHICIYVGLLEQAVC